MRPVLSDNLCDGDSSPHQRRLISSEALSAVPDWQTAAARDCGQRAAVHQIDLEGPDCASAGVDDIKEAKAVFLCCGEIVWPGAGRRH